MPTSIPRFGCGPTAPAAIKSRRRYVELEKGHVKLEKADGTVIVVPLAALSEADQRFIGVAQ